MQTVERYEIVFAVAVCLTLIATPITLFVLRKRGFLDNPNGRSSHVTPTPRGAGLAQMVGVAGALASTGGIPLSGIVAVAGFSVLGGVDDLKSRPPLFRFALQVSIGFVAVVLAFSPQNSFGWQVVFAGAIAVLILVGMVNTTNFMDGINGISLVHGMLFGLVYGTILWRAGLTDWVPLGAALAGVSLAVLPWNWGTSAKVFLGDSGSYLLGASVALLLLATWLIGPGFVVALAPVSIYLADTGSTVLRRAWRRESLTLAHRDHVYQRLVRSWWSHPRTAVLVAGFSALASVIALVLQQGAVSLSVGILLLLGLSGAYLMSPRVVGCGAP